MAAKTDTTLTVSDWKERIRPHLNASMQDVSDAITNAAPIQSWLHEASFEAAEGLGQMHAMQAEAMGHMRMLNDLEDSFPALRKAVHELTQGFGSLDIHWRPLTPNFSRIRVTFDRDYTVESFLSMDEARSESAHSVLDALRSTLPKGDPFPNRPHQVTGLVVHLGVPLGVRLHDRLTDDGRTVRVTLFPDGAKPLEDLPFRVAPRAMVDYFSAETSSS